MNFVDFIIILIVLVFCIRGYLKGFVSEVFSVLILALGLLGAFLGYQSFHPYIRHFIENKDLSLIISFFLIFISITLVLIIIRNTLIRFVDILNLSDMDYLLGILLGLVKGIILCGAVFLFLRNHPILKLDQAIERSMVFPYTERAFRALISLIPDAFEKRIITFLGN